jgi:hypothetical protein
VTVQQMIKTHPQPTSLDRDALLRCIDECFNCAATCTSCADACLGEQDVQDWSAAFASTAIALTVAARRAASSPARPRPMSMCSAQRFEPVRRPVAHVARDATGTPSTTSTAASTPEPAAAASRHAKTDSPRSANQRNRRPDEPRALPDEHREPRPFAIRVLLPPLGPTSPRRSRHRRSAMFLTRPAVPRRANEGLAHGGAAVARRRRRRRLGRPPRVCVPKNSARFPATRGIRSRPGSSPGPSTGAPCRRDDHASCRHQTGEDPHGCHDREVGGRRSDPAVHIRVP